MAAEVRIARVAAIEAELAETLLTGPRPPPHGPLSRTLSCIIKSRRAFPLRSCVKFYTDSGEKVWEGCGKMGKGLEGAKSHDTTIRHDGPDHLGLWCDALPEHQTALITSGCAPWQNGWSATRCRLPGPR